LAEKLLKKVTLEDLDDKGKTILYWSLE